MSIQPGRKKIPIVGIGASAGGLQAFEKFFSRVPADMEAAIVIVQHLDPNHKSILANIIGRYTAMDVSQIQDGVPVQAGKVYIIPPNKDVVFKKGKLLLRPPNRIHGRHLVIDTFFRSLKESLAEKAIAVILSGAGSDGTQGVREVKEAGGLTLVQAPETAQYEGMPLNAVNTGLIDFVVPAEQMPEKIIAYIERELQEKPLIEAGDAQTESDLTEIFNLIQQETGHDFKDYKRNTLNRRLQRRLVVNQQKTLKAYLAFLKQNPAEIEALGKEFLISVTSFFRDSEMFKLARQTVIPKLVSQAKEGKIRVWIPACATGEEAYSWAILLKDYLAKNKLEHTLQIFGSDIDTTALDKAKAGLYPDNIAIDVPQELLTAYFLREKDGFRVKKSIRELIIFAEQNVLQDPPYSQLDLVSCRNLLIYLNPNLQQQVIATFHYALNQNGFLVLGNSGSLGKSADFFKAVNHKHKLFQKQNVEAAAKRLWTFRQDYAAPDPQTKSQEQPRPPSLKEIAQQQVLDRFTPPSVIINDQADILYVQGRTGPYLELTTGYLSSNIITVAREGLKIPLAHAIRKAKTEQAEVVHHNIRVKTNGEDTYIDLIVSPIDMDLPPAGGGNGLLLVVFNPVPRPAVAAESGSVQNETNLILELENELNKKEEYLQSTIEALEASNEALKSANEEAQSANEELQSTNEELETSQEELQSLNEELATTNAQLQDRVDELSRANSMISNLLAGTQIATLFLDKDLRIFEFTPAISKIIALLEADIGRSIKQFTNTLTDENLVEVAHSVLETLTPKEGEVQTADNASFWMRILPYRTVENTVEGVVITFTDITEKKAQEAELEKHRRHLERLVADRTEELHESKQTFENIANNIPGLVLRYKLNPDGSDELIFASKGVESIYEVSQAEAMADITLLWQMIHPADLAEYRASIQKSAENLTFWEREHRILLPDGRVKWLHGRGIPEKQPDGSIIWDTLGVDITYRKEAELALRDSEAFTKAIADLTPTLLYIYDLETEQNIWANTLHQTFFQDILDEDSAKIGKNDLASVVHPDDFALVVQNTVALVENPDRGQFNQELRLNKSGEWRWMDLNIAVFKKNQAGQAAQIIGALSDITDRKKTELALAEALKEKEILLKEVHHRAKNNLQMISSLFYKQQQYIDDEQVQAILQDSTTRVKSMALIHEQLYRSESLSRINLADYTRKFATQLFDSYKQKGQQISLVIQIADIYLPIDRSIPIALILNELLTNSLKHAFPQEQSGEISIECYRDGNEVNLIVRDDGMGLPHDFDLEHTQSLGLYLVYNITVKQLQGKIDIKLRNPTQFHLKFGN